MNRDKVISTVCNLEHEECIKKMKEKFLAWQQNPNTSYVSDKIFLLLTENKIYKKFNFSIDPDLKQKILCFGLKKATRQEWERVRIRTLNDNMTKSERSILQTSLACSADNTIIKDYLNYTLNNDTKLDVVDVVFNICDYSSQTGLDIVIDFVIDKFIHIYQI